MSTAKRDNSKIFFFDGNKSIDSNQPQHKNNEKDPRGEKATCNFVSPVLTPTQTSEKAVLTWNP